MGARSRAVRDAASPGPEAVAYSAALMSQTLLGPAHAELIIKKSRFIACVQPVEGRPQAQAVVDALWRAHPGAAHVCWALMAGGQSAAVDDGEPSGTAGRPMLDVLRHQQLEGVLATVVRYFGGMKLGAGGLVRAYTDSVAQALLGAEKVALQRMAQLRACVPYPLEGLARREIAAAQAQLLEVAHAAQVTLTLALPEDDAAAFQARLEELCAGRVAWLAAD